MRCTVVESTMKGHVLGVGSDSALTMVEVSRDKSLANLAGYTSSGMRRHLQGISLRTEQENMERRHRGSQAESRDQRETF